MPVSVESRKPKWASEIHLWGGWPQAAAPGRTVLALKSQSTSLLCKPSLWVQSTRHPAVSSWYNFGRALASGLLTFNAQEDLFRHRLHRKLFMNGKETVYRGTNESGSTTLSPSEHFVSSFSCYTREFSYCITFRFKTLHSKDRFFSGDFQQRRVDRCS